MAIQIEDIVPSVTEATDRFLVRRGAGPLDHTMELLTLTPEDIAAIVAEVIAARGDRSALGLRLDTIGNFASPNVGGVVVGQYYDQAAHASATATLAGAANRLDLTPFFASTPFRFDRISVGVTTSVSGALGKIVVYDSDSDGWADNLLYESPSNLDFSTNGLKEDTVDIIFESGRTYWLGVRHSSTATLRAITLASCYNLGPVTSTGTAYATTLRRTVTFADPAPDPWVFTNSERQSQNVPAIRMRAAALP